MIGAEALVLQTNVGRHLRRYSGGAGVEVIREIAPGQRDLPDCIRDAIVVPDGRNAHQEPHRTARLPPRESRTIIAHGRRDASSRPAGRGEPHPLHAFSPRPHPYLGVKMDRPLGRIPPKGGARDPRRLSMRSRPARREPAARRREPVEVSSEKDDIVRSAPPTAAGRPARSPATATTPPAISAAAAHGHSIHYITSIWTDPWIRNTLFDAAREPPARSTAPPRNGSTACCWRWPTRWRPARRSCWRPMPATAAG